MLIDQGSAYRQTAEFHPLLISAIKAGVKAWRDLVLDAPGLAKPLDPTTRANIIHNHACHALKVQTADLPSALFDDMLSYYTLRPIESDIILRIKHVGAGRPSNVQTGQQKEHSRQTFRQESLELLGLRRPPTLLTCGYTLDTLKLERVEIRMDCEGSESWWFDIFGGAFVAEPLVFEGTENHVVPAVVKSASGTLKPEEAESRAGK